MKKSPGLLAVMALIALHSAAQFETNYTPVTSQGNLPADFVTLSSQKYQEARSQLSKKEKASARKEKETFLQETSYDIDEMLLNGNAVFNDPMADYVNKVADNALASEPELRKQLRFYIYKSSDVNAFSTNPGIIFVDIGMLAQIENEAELAFVLCHEAIHYKARHVIKEYLEANKINSGKGAYDELNLEKKVLAKLAFSKEQEKEADEKGLEILMHSQYSTAYILGLYDVLKYSYLPFDDVTFDKSFLENATMKFPDGYYKNSTLPIEVNDINDDDTRSTHPAIKFRRDRAAEMIKNADNTGKKEYLVGEAQFKNAQQIARFELCRLYTLRHRYEAGIYTSYLLLKKYPDNIYLKKNVAYCLAGLAEYSDQSRFNDVHHNSDSVEGKVQALCYLMYCLDSIKGDLNIVALAYTAKLKTDYPEDSDVNELYQALMHSLVEQAHYSYSDFSTVPFTAAARQDSIVAAKKDTSQAQNIPPANDAPQAGGSSKYDKLRKEEAEKEKSKYEKLREQEKEIQKTVGQRFAMYAFVDLMKKSWFVNDFHTSVEARSMDKIKKKEIDLDEEMNSRRNWEKHSCALGAEKLVIVNPVYARINNRKKQNFRFMESEGGQVDFAERLKLNARRAKLGCEVLNTRNLGETETGKLNEVSIMKDYIAERLSLDKGVTLPYAERQRVMAIAKKYGTDYFMWTGAISLTEYERRSVMLIVLTTILPPVLPFTLAPLINGGQYTLYYALVYDVKNDELKMATYREINNRTKGYILNSHIYDVLSQVKSKK